MPVNQDLLLEAASQRPSAIIDLFDLDLTKQGGPHVYFHPGSSFGNLDVIFQGVEYSAWPMQTNGFQWTTSGTQPRPTVAFSNVMGTFTQVNQQFNGCIGCQITRTRTFARFLDGLSTSDPGAHFPSEMWVINRKTDENRISCTYELANPMDFEDLLLPRRRVLADLCQWDYRGSGCGYTGIVLTDKNDTPLPYNKTFYGEWSPFGQYTYGAVVQVSFVVPQFFVCVYPSGGGNGAAQAPPEIGTSNYWARDECSLRLSGCRLRFGIQTTFYTISGVLISVWINYFTSITGQVADATTSYLFWHLHVVSGLSLATLADEFGINGGTGPITWANITQFDYAFGIASVGGLPESNLVLYYQGITGGLAPTLLVAWQLYILATYGSTLATIFTAYQINTGTITTDPFTAISEVYAVGRPTIEGIPILDAYTYYQAILGIGAPNATVAFKFYYMSARGVTPVQMRAIAQALFVPTTAAWAEVVPFVYQFYRYPVSNIVGYGEDTYVSGIALKALNAFWIMEFGTNAPTSWLAYMLYKLISIGYYYSSIFQIWYSLIHQVPGNVSDAVDFVYSYLKLDPNAPFQAFMGFNGVPQVNLDFYWLSTIGSTPPDSLTEYKWYLIQPVSLAQAISICGQRGINFPNIQEMVAFTYQYIKSPGDPPGIVHTPYPVFPGVSRTPYPPFPGIVTNVTPPGPLPFGGFPGTRETPISLSGP